MALVGFDSSLLMNYYGSRLPVAGGQSASARNAGPPPPWDLSVTLRKPPKEKADVAARSSDPYFDPKDVSLTKKAGGELKAASQLEGLLASRLSNASANADSAFGADNNKLFALYKALDRLDYISKMATRDGANDALRAGLDKNFQDGLAQVQAFVGKAEFDKLSVSTGKKAATVQSAVTIAYAKSDYIGGTAARHVDVFKPVAEVSASDTFTVSVTKAGVKSDVLIDLANVQGPLTIDNIAAYVNSQLSASGFGTRFSRVQTGGDIVKDTATWGFKITNLPSETVELSSGQTQAAIYLAGVAGEAKSTEGRLVKLSNLDGAPDSEFSANIKPATGAASARATATDSDGNVYIVGNSTGSFGAELNQGAEDVFLTKYDSAGNVQWTKLLGSAGTANGYGIAVDPASGGVVIAGSVTGDLTPTAIGSGTDSFVAKYDTDGNQKWLRQVAPGSNDQANAVSVDASGNVYVGGQVATTIAAGQTSAGGADAYLTKLDSKGTLVYQRQFGSAGSDSAAKTAIASDGNVIVASVENGHAILSKFASGNGTSAAMWRMDLGDLQGGALGGLVVSGSNVYLSGASANASLHAGVDASIANANSGGTDAFVFAATDSGASVDADFISYVGTGSAEQAGGLAVADGKIYLAGTTTGTFAGQIRTVADTHNMFVAQIESDGTHGWTQQYGGLGGESRGLAIAADDSGASVLDALKLPRGKIDVNQSSQLESQTTMRAGDYFSLQVVGRSGTRTVKVTVSKGETLRSLATKINGALLFDGKAKALGAKGGQGLNIAVNPGVQVTLIPGAKDFDALAGLGIKPQMLSNDADPKDKSQAAVKKASEAAEQTIGLAIDEGLDLKTKNTAAHAHVVLLGAMAQIKQAYGKLNAPPASTLPTASGPAPAYMQSQLAGYQSALYWLSSSR